MGFFSEMHMQQQIEKDEHARDLGYKDNEEMELCILMETHPQGTGHPDMLDLIENDYKSWLKQGRRVFTRISQLLSKARE